MTMEETMEDDATVHAANNEGGEIAELHFTRVTLTLTVVGKDKSRQDTRQQLCDFI